MLRFPPHSLRRARAKVVKGKIVTCAKLPEGAKLTILVDDDGSPLLVGDEDAAAIARGVEEISGGKGIPLSKFLRNLRRY